MLNFEVQNAADSNNCDYYGTFCMCLRRKKKQSADIDDWIAKYMSLCASSENYLFSHKVIRINYKENYINANFRSGIEWPGAEGIRCKRQQQQIKTVKPFYCNYILTFSLEDGHIAGK